MREEQIACPKSSHRTVCGKPVHIDGAKSVIFSFVDCWLAIGASAYGTSTGAASGERLEISTSSTMVTAQLRDCSLAPFIQRLGGSRNVDASSANRMATLAVCSSFVP